MGSERLIALPKPASVRLGQKTENFEAVIFGLLCTCEPTSHTCGRHLTIRAIGPTSRASANNRFLDGTRMGPAPGHSPRGLPRPFGQPEICRSPDRFLRILWYVVCAS